MALVDKAGIPSLASVTPPQASTIIGLKAGEAIAAGDLCRVHSDGTVMRSNGTANDAAAKFDGICFVAAQVGEAVTLYTDVTVRYGAGLTPGARFYVAATAGRLDTAATTGGLIEIGKAIDATRIRFQANR